MPGAYAGPAARSAAGPGRGRSAAGRGGTGRSDSDGFGQRYRGGDRGPATGSGREGRDRAEYGQPGGEPECRTEPADERGRRAQVSVAGEDARGDRDPERATEALQRVRGTRGLTHVGRPDRVQG